MVISAVFLSFLFIFFSLFHELQKARGEKKKKVMVISAIIIIFFFFCQVAMVIKCSCSLIYFESILCR